MTNLILPRRRRLIASAAAAGLAAASPAMGHNGGPPITDGEVRAAIEDVRRVGIELPWGSLPTDATLAMFMLAKTSNMLVGGGGGAAVLKPQDVFATTLYTGSGANRTITTGLDMSGFGGLIWAKNRSATEYHNLYDTLRGANKRLLSNSTSAEIPYTDTLTAFGSNGFSLGVDSGGGINTSGDTYVAWSFRRAAKFFDVVTWTGDGTSGRAIPHALATTPGMVIVKRANASTQWYVWHAALGNARLRLNNTAAAVADNGVIFGDGSSYIAPTTSDFTVSGFSEVNGSGGDYVAYVFAHDADPSGIIQCGSVAGGSSVNLGWRPQYVLLKGSAATTDWNIHDSARGMDSSPDPILYANTSGAEDTPADAITLSSTGFATTSYWSGINLIYLAIREPI